MQDLIREEYLKSCSISTTENRRSMYLAIVPALLILAVTASSIFLVIITLISIMLLLRTINTIAYPSNNMFSDYKSQNESQVVEDIIEYTKINRREITRIDKTDALTFRITILIYIIYVLIGMLTEIQL